MKKRLLLVITFILMAWYNLATAQCNVTNVIVSKVSTSAYGSDSLLYTIDLQFDATVNGGNKDIWLHVWRESDYPFTDMNLYNCTGQQSTAPAPATFTELPKTLDVLDKAFITFGFDDNLININNPGTAGIYTNYHYDPAVVPNYAGATIYKVAHATDPGIDHIYIQNLSFKVSNLLPGFLQVRAFNWSTEGDQKPQCWGCGTSFVVDDPKVSGSINCTATRTYNINIQSKYDDASLPGIQTITGFYQLYLDVNRNSVIDQETDILAHTSTAFTTAFVPGTIQPGYNSAYVGSVLAFNNYVFQNGDTNSNKPIIALVNVTTPGYLGAGKTGILINPCTVLPLTITNFQALMQQGNVMLKWAVANEYDVEKYVVQRRADNGQFATLGSVPAAELNNYAFTDNVSGVSGVMYYRLQIVEKNGTINYSDVRVVRINTANTDVMIYPNPAVAAFSIAVPADAGSYDISISDISGRIIKTMNTVRSQSVYFNQFVPGIYIVKVQFKEAGVSVTKRIVVQ
ncbi:putative secreted protein (Por secretion system target) [Lacibacter cauensis]|uniref:Putative secreted protein (Por secretion system target) n=1 Tax=Lacibacter cauensis TaxID=510947 RepID=A0A562SD68_9BACT|nr:T9SS type A sorting domain-containing protein [Lacibacter cauensis]TWI79113.1 putative secreted protein (Por secretion system target) [Lacibacter cauensis]